jgi:hypothetical protein
MTESREESQRQEEEAATPRQDGEGEEVMYPASNPDELPRVTPGRAGYDDRDPAKDMPRVPSSPETQDD